LEYVYAEVRNTTFKLAASKTPAVTVLLSRLVEVATTPVRSDKNWWALEYVYAEVRNTTFKLSVGMLI
jgi:hypothetical protein